MEQSALLSCPKEGGGKATVGGPKVQGEPHSRVGPHPPISRIHRASQYRPKYSGWFHWPGLDGDVKRFCQSCPTCQVTTPNKPSPSPLIPLPIIEVTLRHDWDGSGRPTAKISLGARTHPRHHGLRHPVLRSHSPSGRPPPGSSSSSSAGWGFHGKS